MALFGLGNKKKIEKVKQLLEAQDYEQAALAADEIQIKHLKSAHELNLVGKAYKCNGDFLNAKDAFERSYKIRCSRPVLVDIMDCCLEINDMTNAEVYFNEYQKVAPEDKVVQYKYRYRIEKKKCRERRLLITILEELKALDYIEEFAYELARQYHKAGMAEECMKECEDIILWFVSGPTVERAKTLLAYYKGEISLEEIKAAGTRYHKEVTHLVKKEMPAIPAVEKTAEIKETEDVAETERAEEIAAGLEVEAAPASESSIQQETIQEAAEKLEPDTEDFVLPEIDLSDISFEEEDTLEENNTLDKYVNKKTFLQENSREEEELYVLETETVETTNERLAELLKKKQISIPEMLGNFGQMERIQKQVVKSLELAVNDREKSYFVITGEPQTGKTTLALSLIRLLFELDLVKYDRTATIDAVQLNQVSIEDYGEELKNCSLIIENAGGMTKESVDGLLRFSKGSRGKTCVILEDNVRDINKFLRARDELNSLFNNRIHLGKYNEDDLMRFAYAYIKNEDYGIDKMAAQVLSDKISEIVRNYGNEQRLLCTLELVRATVARAEKRASSLILSMAAEGKIQQGNYLVIIVDDIVAEKTE